MFATRSSLGAPPKPRNTIRVNTTPAGCQMAERSLFRTPLLSIYNALQAAEDRLSTSRPL